MWANPQNRRCTYRIVIIIFLLFMLALRVRYLSLLPNEPAAGPFEETDFIPETTTLRTKMLWTTHARRLVIKSLNDSKVKYILIWTPGFSPFECFRESGHDLFLKHNCEYTNCYVTYNRAYLGNETEFDAVLFSIVGMQTLPTSRFKPPKHRSPKQKYIAVSARPASRYPITHPLMDNYFNWTWTYRYKSDIVWRSYRINDVNGTEVGPRENVRWQNHYGPIPDEVQDFLLQKNKMAAWIIPECSTKYNPRPYISDLNKALSKYGFEIDILGKKPCGMECGSKHDCYKVIEKEYCFYLALDIIFDEDYFSDIISIALNNYAIPIVFDEDNMHFYKRFLPPGSYIDGSKMSPGVLAHQMKRIMENYTLQQEFFKWRSTYFYEPIPCGAEICNLCEALNTKATVRTSYKEFRTWWNGKPVLTVGDMVLSIFLSEPQMVKLIIGKNYSALVDMFEKKYIPKMYIPVEPPPLLMLEPDSFNFTTTDANTGTGLRNDSQDYSTVFFEDD